ncbi:AraC family transcriptional regulator [Bradyrhizobium sp. SZCCHNPS2010]|uniref:helix-turn-helix transcriptional regulator n=1 Tax=Bradyrhizobium sp. SZCCHNPS2010 TaxID=3057333 RepID=UPI00291637D9|nr:AraC family transcriptional regulator [Bradyrhizobium sp. SZCCHNPS2010]
MLTAEPQPAALPHRSAMVRLDSDGVAVAVLPARPYDVTYVSDHHTIGFTFERQTGVGSFASDRRRPFQADPWRLAFTPAGCEVFSSSRRGGEYVVLSIAPEVLARLAPWIDQGRLPQFTNLEDAPFTSLAIGLRRSACCNVAGDDLDIAPLVAAAVERLALRIEDRTTSVGIARCMTQRRMKRIFEYLDAHLDGNVRLIDLARQVNLSEAYLARAFKAATGTTLHGALMDRRIAHARALIADARRHRPDMRLADIASESGFSSHAHMTTAFRRVLGITPAKWAIIAGR